MITSRRRRIVANAALYATVVLAAAPRLAGAQALPTSDECRSCHLTLGDERLSQPARVYEGDIHAANGFGCLACHGGVGDHLDPASGFLSAPDRREIPAVCGRCHSDGAYMREFNPSLRTDQVSEYWTSIHGQKLRDENDPDVAVCTDCHVVHQILPASDPASSVHPSHVVDTCSRCHGDPRLMGLRGIGTSQVEEYRESVHGKLLLEEGDLSAPACNDCHGNHGAAPPGVSSVRNVCGQCHSVMADYFAQSAHVPVFDDENLPGCAYCHSRHAIQPVSDAFISQKSEDVCKSCHQEGDPNGREFDVIAHVLDSLDMRIAESREVLEEAENAGMEVSQALFELDDANNARTRARSAIHTFHSGPVREEIAAGLEVADATEERGVEALEDHRFRRVGLGVSSIIILMLMSALYLKIREMEATPPAHEESKSQ